MLERLVFDSIEQVYEYLERNYGKNWYLDYFVQTKKLKDGKYEATVYRTSDLPSSEYSEISQRDLQELEKLLSDIPEKEYEEKIELEEYKEPLIIVNLSEDEMLASITIVPGVEKELPSKEDILKALRENKVVMGIDENAIEKALKEKKVFVPVVVAKGEKAKPSVDAKLDIKFKEHSKIKSRPECEEFEKIIKCCDEKEILAEKIPPVEGKDGYTVTGKIIKTEKPKDINLYDYLGENVEISEDKNKIISKIPGEPYIDRFGRISVRRILIIEGDLKDYGNIDFPGPVVIKGNAEGNYEIISGGDLLIKGVIGGVAIKCEGNIFIEKGIFGKAKGGIECKKNLRTLYINNSLVKSEGNIIVEDYIMDSVVIAKGTIIVNGRGTIIGGKVYAGENISCNLIGSSFGAVTHIGCGIDYEKTSQLLELEEEFEGKFLKLTSVIKLILKFERISKQFPENDRKKYLITLRKLNDMKDTLQKSINRLKEKMDILKRDIMLRNLKIRNRILVYKNCREAVIQIGNKTLKVTNDTGPGFFELDHVEGKIVFHGKAFIAS